MKKYVFTCMVTLFIVCGFLMCIPSSGVTADEKVYILRHSYYRPNNVSYIVHGVIPWEQRIEKRSNGRIKFKNFWAGSLHSIREGVDAIRNDITDFTYTYAVHSPDTFDTLNAVNHIPLLFPNAYVETRVLEELYSEFIKDEYEKLGLMLWAMGMGTEDTYISNKPVRLPKDLKGLKARSLAGLANDILVNAGTTTISMSSADLYNGFARGMIEITPHELHDVVSDKLYEVIDYVIAGPKKMGWLGTGMLNTAMNPKTYKKLPKDLQQIIWEENRRLGAEWSIAVEQSELEAQEVIDTKMTVIKLSEEEIGTWKAYMEPLIQNYLDTRKDSKTAKRFYAECKRLSAKYADATPEEILQLQIEKPVKGLHDPF
jgi:C4-dicarboxylate-binding protein DctP